MEQELLALPEQLSPSTISCRVRVAQMSVVCVMLYRPIYVFLPFFILPLHCLSCIDLRFLSTNCVSAISIRPAL